MIPSLALSVDTPTPARAMRLNQLLVHIVTCLSKIPDDELDTEIERILAEIAQFIGAERAYVFRRNDTQTRSFTNTHHWCAEDIPPRAPYLDEVYLARLGWISDPLLTEKVLQLADASAATPSQQVLVHGQPVASLLMVPLQIAGQMVGWVGVDMVRASQSWGQDAHALLHTAAAVISTALERSDQWRANMERDYFLLDQTQAAYQDTLEQLVAERTAALQQLTDQLQQEVTDHKRTQIQLREAQSSLRLHLDDLGNQSRATMLAELSSSLAHELNQPLAAIVNYTQGCMLRLRATPNVEPLLKAMEQVWRESERAAEIVRRLRALFQQGAPQREQVSLNALVERVVGLFASDISRARVDVSLDLDPDLPLCNIDSSQVEILLLNITRNALEALGTSSFPRSLRYVSSYDRQHACVAIEDSGADVDAALVEAIFEPFFTTRPHGTGIGLYISRAIAQSHGGWLRLEAATPQRMKHFVFAIPYIGGVP